MYHMKYTSFFSWAVLASCTFLNNVAAEEIAILGDIPFDIEEIDLTYSETAPPRISFRSTLPTRRTVPPFRPSIEQFDLLPIVKATKSSVCEPLRTEQPGTWTVTIPPHGPERCEAMMTVQTST